MLSFASRIGIFSNRLVYWPERFVKTKACAPRDRGTNAGQRRRARRVMAPASDDQ
jgi:hypothetical protein